MAIAIDWNINIGQIFTVISLVGGGVYQFIKVRFELRIVTESLAKIERDLDAAIRDNSLLSNTIAVLQQRMITVEQELGRARDNIHKLANVVQADIRKYGG